MPAVFHMEGLCGAFIQDAASLPSGIGRGSSFDPELEEKLSDIVARQETAVGITQVLAPVLDIFPGIPAWPSGRKLMERTLHWLPQWELLTRKVYRTQ